jgi:hypothetical protein
MLFCQLMYHRNFRFTDFLGIHSGYAYPFVMDIKHYFCSVRGGFMKYGFEDGDDEFHGGIIVIMEQYLVHRRFFGLNGILGCYRFFSLGFMFGHGHARISETLINSRLSRRCGNLVHH